MRFRNVLVCVAHSNGPDFDRGTKAGASRPSRLPTLELARDTEALHATAIVGQVPVAKCSAKVVGGIIPGSAARYAPRTITGCPHASVAGIAGVRFVPAILCPVPYIAMDIVEAPRIGSEAVNSQRRLTPLPSGALTIGLAIVVGELGRNRRSPPERRGGAGACRILAFRLRRQAIKLPGFFGQPGGISLGSLEIDARHRMPGILGKPGRPPGSI